MTVRAEWIRPRPTGVFGEAGKGEPTTLSPTVNWTVLENLFASDDTTYTIALRADDGEGGVTTASTTLTIINLDPTADANGPYVMTEGNPLPLDASASADPGNDALTYAWDLDNDGVYETDAAGQAKPNIPWATLEGLGLASDGSVLTIGLQVDDGQGGVDTTTSSLTIINVSPTADAGGPYTIDEGQDVVLDAGGSTDPGNDVLTYAWDLDNDGNYGEPGEPTTVNPTVSWATLAAIPGLDTNSGINTIGVEVDDGDGGVTTTTTTLTINNVAPTADAGINQTSYEGSLVAFNGTFTDPAGPIDAPYTFLWDFGDGNNAATQNAAHTYVDDGVYTVTFTVTDKDGGTDTDTIQLTVLNVAPTANAGSDQTVDEGDGVVFNGRFTDPGVVDTHTFHWDFGDGGTAATEDAVHTYRDNGVYTVIFTVLDDDGGIDFDSMRVTVNNVAPTVDAGVDQTVDEGDKVNFSGLFTDPGIDDTHTILWDFGDGNTADALDASNIYTDNGVYTVRLTVTDDDGGVGFDELTVTVNNVAPVVVVGPDLVANENDEVNFFGNSFTDAGIDDTHTVLWDFGDGGTAVTLSAAHTYLDNGDYTARLTVTDDDGGVGFAEVLVTVNNVAPEVEAGGDMASVEGDPVNFSGRFTDVGTLDTHTVLWEFGDGNTATELETIHTYVDNGIYTARLTVTDDDGGVTFDELEVIVNNEEPVVYAGQDQDSFEGDVISFSGEFTDVGLIDTHNIEWDFGDGHTANTLNADHIYTDNGVFVARLTVIDNNGDLSFDEVTVVVSNVAPEVEAGEDRLVDAGVPIEFAGVYSDVSIEDTHTFLWDFGDGTTADTLNATHTYLDSGVYTVSLTVTDDDLGETIDTLELTVQEDVLVENGTAYFYRKSSVVVVSLLGPGVMDVNHIDGIDTDFNSIILTDTTIDSALTINTFGSYTRVEVGDIIVNSSLDRIVAKTMALHGNIEIDTGSLRFLRLDDITDDSQIRTAEASQKDFKFRADEIGENVDFVIPNRISKFQANKYASGSLTAESINTVNIQQGDFDVDVTAQSEEGINSITVGGNIEGTIESASHIKKVVSKNGGLADGASVIANNGSIGKAQFATDVDGIVLASERINKITSKDGVLTGTVRAAERIGKVQFNDIQAATVSSGAEIGSVISKNSIVDSVLLSGYDIGADGLAGTGDDSFNTESGIIGKVKVNKKTGNFDNSYAMAGVKPFDYDVNTGTWTMLAPQGQTQDLALFGKIGKATVGQVFLNGDPNTGIYGLFAATEDVKNVKFTEISAAGAPDFEFRPPWL